MTDPERLRDSTQIVLPCETLADLRGEVESEFAVTVFTADRGTCRIVGSPTEIKAVGRFLARNGINVA